MKHIKLTTSFKFFLAAVFGLTTGWSAVTQADDTEVFFTAAANQGASTIRPNILFVLDTSSSMNAEVEGTGLNRLENMKLALQSVLATADNVNVGLMRFHDRGGPVLYPVSYIDEVVEQGVEAGTVIATIKSGNDDATQHLGDQSVDLSSSALTIGIQTVSASASSATISTRVSASNDDAEERISSGDMDRSSSDLELIREGGDQLVGIRFRNLSIPPGVTIESAQMVFEIDEEEDRSTNLVIQAENIGNAPAFSNNDDDISDRNRTTASANWNNLPTLDVNSILTSADFSSVVQEVVDHPDWAEGNSMVVILSGSGRRTVESFDGDSDEAPQLNVTFSKPTTGSTARSLVGLRFQNVNIPQDATITSAVLDLVADSNTSSSAINFTVVGEDVDNSAAFTSATNNLAARSVTSAALSVNNQTAWDQEDVVHSYDVSDIVQEIVDRNGWCGNNAMSLLVLPDPNEDLSEAELGQRFAKSFDLDPGSAATLRVEYDPESIGVGEGCVNAQVIRRVSAGNDDAEEDTSGNIDLSSSDLELVRESTNQEIGIRFSNINVGQGATVLSANIQFTADETNSETTNLTFHAENDISGDSAQFTSANGAVSDRTTTLSSVNWNNVPAWNTIGERFTTPDLSPVVQEVFNNPSWDSGNALTFIVTGSGKRVAESVNGSAGDAPLLTLVVQGAAEDTPPVTVRTLLSQVVDDIQYKSGTPIVSTLFEAASYYRGDSVHYGRTRGQGSAPGQGGSLSRSEFTRVSHPDSFVGPAPTRPDDSGNICDSSPTDSDCITEFVDGTATYISPMEFECQSNFLVLLSDGSPSRRVAVNDGLLPGDLLDTTCAGSGNAECGRELVSFLRNVDQSSTLDDSQTITTHTIGFNFAGDQFLQDLATEGGGDFFEADTAAQLAAVFEEIVADALESNTTFVAPAVTINSFNPLTNRDELYFALFRPSNEPRWKGNLKRYRLAGGELLDVNGNSAVDSSTGFFASNSKSFWTPGSTVDGPDVAIGGAASVLGTNRRVFYTDGGSVKLMADNENDFLVDPTILGLDPTATSGTVQNILDWAQGTDLNDEDEDGATDDARLAMGAPLHALPVLVSYGPATPGGEDFDGDGETTDEDDLTVFLTTNEGYIHMFDARTGQEYASIIPEEMLPNLPIYFNNVGNFHPQGTDGAITLWIEDNDSDGKIEPEQDDHVYLYVTMRRGGDQIYAFDVTNRLNPTLLWKIVGGTNPLVTPTPGFAELGQTWSKPILTKIKTDSSTVKDVLIFGGGYDDDQDDHTVRTPDDIGRAIYIVDAETGALIWWAGPQSHRGIVNPDLEFQDSVMTNSFPANLRVIDLNGDGIADRIYAADVGAQLWRFDLVDDGNIVRTSSGRIARLGDVAEAGNETAANNRRFYNSPDVSLVQNSGGSYLAIAIGSGYRAHPLNTVIEDRFYVIRDRDVFSSSTSSLNAKTFDPVIDSKLVDVTNNIVADALELAVDIDGDDDIDQDDVLGIKLRMTRSGEKVLTDSVTFDSEVTFASFEPVVSANESCQAQEGTARLYRINLETGAPTQNLDESSDDLELSDRSLQLGQGGIPPTPALLFPEGEPGGLPQNVLIAVGPELIQGAAIKTLKTSWQRQDAVNGTSATTVPETPEEPQQ